MKTKFLAVLLLLLGASATAVGDRPSRADATFQVRSIPAFTMEVPGKIIRQQEWPGVTNPRKFIFEVVVEAGDTTVWVHYWPLDEKDGTWWLEEVFGFLFQPETRVEADISSTGHEVYFVEIPAAPGAEEELNALVVTQDGAFRLTCPGCRDRGGLTAFTLIADTLDVLETR